jgi:pilus assembly protein CpaC
MIRALFGALACAVAASAALPMVAHADTMASEPALRRTIHVPRDKSLSFRLGQPATRIVIAQPEIAKVTGTSDRSFYVQGIEFGSTNMLVYGPGGRLHEVIDVRVGYDAEGLQEDLVAAFPGEPIRVRNLGETILLTGEVSSTGVQDKAEKIAGQFAPEAVISRLTVKSSQQVILEVRVLEASRNALQDMGVNLDVFNESFRVLTGTGLIGGLAPPHANVSTFGGVGRTNIDTTLQALEEKGVIRTLAKPNLVAISGQKASFLAGGEFPFPVPRKVDEIVIEFRPYGVKLNFLPRVKDNGWIEMMVEPEVSELDFNNALTISSITVPALTVRRASTTLELKPGDTFAMAGMFQREYENTVQQTPGLANLPVLGALFRSARWKRNETELLILVTPRLATAADRQAQPIDSLPGREPSATDIYLFGRNLDKKIERERGPADVAR